MNALHLFIKIAAGMLIVPIGILAQNSWPWWERSSLAVKIVSAPVMLPLIAIAYATSFWWNEY